MSSRGVRLLVSCRYIDELLADVEEILNGSASKSPFPRWRDDTSPVQRKVVQDYNARLRAQLVRILDGYDLVSAGPTISAIHAIRGTLDFVDISAEELKPKYMRGYGELPEAMMPELNGEGAAESIPLSLKSLAFGSDILVLPGPRDDLKHFKPQHADCPGAKTKR